MNNKSINSNKQFMIGNGILAFGVFFIVCLFLYLGFRNQSKSNDKEKTFAGIYTVENCRFFHWRQSFCIY